MSSATRPSRANTGGGGLCKVIISYAHNFIYFRPKKTGSSTIVDVLRPSLGENDISRARSLGERETEVPRALHMKAAEVKAVVP